MKPTDLLARASIAACCVALCACASTQPHYTGSYQPAGPRKDPQAAFEPRSEPGEGQKFLSRMAGDWTVAKTFYPRNGDPVLTRGTCKQHMIHEGRFLESDFVFDDAAGKTTGTGVIGFDPQSGKFTSFWVDSRSTRFSVRGSEVPFDGQKIELVGQTIGEPPPNARRSRTVSTLEDGDKKLVHRQYSVTPNAPDRLVMQLELTRKR